MKMTSTPPQQNHKPGCKIGTVCAVYHTDGICDGPYGKCTCNEIAEQPPQSDREKKYRSVWQVLNAKNPIEDKYIIIERLIDGIITQSTSTPAKSPSPSGEEHEHTFWKDENPPTCFGCGKTKAEIMFTPTSPVEEGCSMSKLTDIYEREGLIGVQSFIRSAISRARKEERERVVKMIEGMKVDALPVDSLEGIKINGKSIKELVSRACDARQNATLTALTDKLK